MGAGKQRPYAKLTMVLGGHGGLLIQCRVESSIGGRRQAAPLLVFFIFFNLSSIIYFFFLLSFFFYLFYCSAPSVTARDMPAAEYIGRPWL
jgi:hypothetical protein